MPGCGTKRSRPTSNETLTSIASELNQDIKDAGLKDVILIGHSIAGVLLPMMAAENPSLFSKLIYLATNLPLEGESINQTMGMTVHGEDPDRVGFPLNPLTTSKEDLAMAMFGPDLSPEQLGWLMSEVAQDKPRLFWAMSRCRGRGMMGRFLQHMFLLSGIPFCHLGGSDVLRRGRFVKGLLRSILRMSRLFRIHGCWRKH
jgi:pimeloyl-ACP methyl ester carboxylesterase